MAHVMFNPSTVNSDLSSTKSRMNFQKFINDYNNGLIDKGNTSKISSLSILVHNVKKDQTVNATVSVYNQIINRSFTSRYEDTISRNIYQDLSIAINPTSFINYLNSNGGNLDATITSGTANYNTPVVIGTEFRTKEIAGVKSGQVTITGSEVDKAIRVTRTDNVNGIYVELDSYNGKEYVELFKGASNGTFVDIPAGTITDLSLEYYVWVYAGLLLESNGPTKLNEGSDSAFLKFKLDNLTVSNPTISNLATVGDYWEKPITVNWRSTHQEGYEWEAYYNNQRIRNGTGRTETSFTLPANTFSGTLPSSVKVRVYRDYGGTRYYSGWQEVSLRLKDITASISELSVNADNIDYAIPITWSSVNQSKWKIEVIQAGVVKNTFSGDSQKSYTIPAKSIAFYGSAVFKLSVAYTGYGNVDRWVTKEVTKTLTRITATSSNLIVAGEFWEREISLSWQSTNQHKYEVTILKGNTLVKTYTGTTATSLKIPASTLSAGEHTFRVRTAYTGSAGDAWSAYTTKNITLKDVVATISNLLVSGDLWEAPINLSWQSTEQQQFKIEVLKENIVVRTYTGTTAKHYIIPAGQLSKGEHVFRVWVGYANRFVNNQTRSLTLKDIEATISNLLVEGDYWENPIKVSWQSSNQQQFKVEVLKSNQVVKTYTGTTATSYTIPAEKLTEGQQVIKVTVAYSNRYVNSASKTVTLKNIVATLDNINLSGSNIDLALSLSWSSSNQQKYEVEIYKGDAKVKNYSGTTAVSVSIPNNSLTTGLHRFRVRVAFKDRWTNWEEITSTLTETLPSIGVLEPDGVITERDNPTRVWWTSQNQSKWKLVIDESTTYTGTTEKEKILIAGALQTGKHSMVLTVTYRTSAGVEKHVTKKAEWIVQGRPPTPTITSSSTFTTSRPTITWDTQDQQSYILELLKGSEIIHSTDWNNGLYVSHKINDYLANGSYTVRVKVMNQYSLESEWGTKQITINATENTVIKLSSISVQNTVELRWDNPNNKFTKFYIIRNNEVIAKTTNTYYTDYTPHKDCIYVIRGINASDVYKDSNRSYEYVEINRSVLATVDKLDDQLNCAFFTSSDRFNATLGLECTLIEVSGRPYPIAIFGEHQSKVISLNLLQCDSLDKLIEMFHRREVFCYRDHSEKVFFVIPSLPYNRNSILSDHEGTISATVVDYKERVDYE